MDQITPDYRDQVEMNERDEEPLYIDTRAMLASNAGIEASGIAMDLIMYIWWPAKQPFLFDVPKICAYLAEKLPRRGYSEEVFNRNVEHIKSFFTVLPDGRWVPSPEYFSLSNGNPGSES